MTSTDSAVMHHFDETTAAFFERVTTFARARANHHDEHVLPPASSSTLFGMLEGAITPGGIGFERAFDLFEQVVARESQTPEHPRFLAFVPYAPAAAGAIFDMALGVAGIFGSSWLEAAGATAAENQALRWLADLAGMPRTAGGTFVSGGTIANVNGLAVARHAWRSRHGDSGRRVAVATSAEVHSSVRLAAKVLEIDIVEVPTDARGRITGERMREVLDTTSAEVCGIAATAGITNLGMVDDLAGLAEIARERGLWFHVDGAYGGAALASPTARPLFAGIEWADSLVIDPHKWLFSPLDCSALLYRDPELARSTFSQSAAYLDALKSHVDYDPDDLAFHLTRRSRGLPFWFTLAVHGSEAMCAAVEHGLLLAKHSAQLIHELPYLELAIEPELSVVVFRRIGWDRALLKRWSDQQLATGNALVLPTTWHGESLMRFCFVNPRTTLDDVRGLLDSMANDPA